MIKGSRKFIVEKDSKLLEFLYEFMEIKSKNKVKAILKNGSIKVNGFTKTAFDFELRKNDVLIYEPNKKIGGYHKDIEVIYNDDNYLAINKPSGLLSSSDDVALKNAFDILSENLNYNVFLVHRIDRETSGILLFVKDNDLRKELQENWNDIILKREYYGVVKNKLREKSKTLINNLEDGRNTKVVISETGKEAITKYELIEEVDNLSLVKFEIETGRRNQIRVQMAGIGNPILGDRKYGNGDFSKRLMLHSTKLEFVDPITKKEIKINCNYPIEFKKILKRK